MLSYTTKKEVYNQTIIPKSIEKTKTIQGTISPYQSKSIEKSGSEK